jgi:LacI family transcriptional regulator
MATGIKDVAALAGVSVGTVSNFLNRPEVVSQSTRLRIESAVASLGFVRNESARQLRAGRSSTLGLVVLDVANPFFTDVARGAELVADSNDTMVMLCNTGEDPAREQRQLERLEEQRVLGVLITPVDGDHVRIDEMVRRGTPVVLVDRRSPQHRMCSVSVDDVKGGRLAVQHLIEQGHRRIGFVGGSATATIQQVRERHEGALQAMGSRADDLVVIQTPALSIESGRLAAAMVAAMPVRRRPSALFCANDLLALGALQELSRLGLRVPQDVALVGYDDIGFAEAAVVALSSVRQPR